MDSSWQAIQNWALFGAIAIGAGYYYWPKGKHIAKPGPAVKEAKKEIKKTTRKIEKPKQKDTPKPYDEPETYADAAKKDPVQNNNKKRKVDKQPADPAVSRDEQQDNQNEIDMSTRQFAANMQKARQGIQVKSTNNNQTRVKTVKAKQKGTQSPIADSESSLADGDDDDWSPVVSSEAQANGIDDMLEPAAPGPSALRITAPEKPTKEKINRQPKKQEVETKKQRQNRKKAEEARIARAEAEREQKAKGEAQRRAARESRGEPAKNGVPIPSAPVQNPWREQNAVRDTQLPAVSNTGAPVELLDTLDTESNSSSHQEASTTAATSVTDATPEVATAVAASDAAFRWSDDVPAGESEYAKAIEESERETGWNEVKTSKKSKKSNSHSNTNGNATTPGAVQSGKPIAASRSTMFSALGDNEA